MARGDNLQRAAEGKVKGQWGLSLGGVLRKELDIGSIVIRDSLNTHSFSKNRDSG